MGNLEASKLMQISAKTIAYRNVHISLKNLESLLKQVNPDLKRYTLKEIVPFEPSRDSADTGIDFKFEKITETGRNRPRKNR